ncbi:MAG: hypothetical protein ACM3UZ_12025 [Acidobacteriota bacterium]
MTEMKLLIGEFHRIYGNDLILHTDQQVANKISLINMFVLFMQICLSIDISRDVIENFWNKKGIDDPFQRLKYIIDHHPKIINHGPYWTVAEITFMQIEEGKINSRGAIFDGLHGVYLPFVTFFLTSDQHFIDLKYRLPIALRNLTNKILDPQTIP